MQRCPMDGPCKLWSVIHISAEAEPNNCKVCMYIIASETPPLIARDLQGDKEMT